MGVFGAPNTNRVHGQTLNKSHTFMFVHEPGWGRPRFMDKHVRMLPCFMFIHEGIGCFFVDGWVLGFMDSHGGCCDDFFFAGSWIAMGVE